MFLATQRPPSEGDVLLPARMIALRCLSCLISAMLEGASSDHQLNNHLVRMINKLSYVFWQQVSGLIRHSDTLSPLLTDVFICLLNASFDVFSHLCASGKTIYGTSSRTTLFSCTLLSSALISATDLLFLYAKEPSLGLCDIGNV